MLPKAKGLSTESVRISVNIRVLFSERKEILRKSFLPFLNSFKDIKDNTLKFNDGDEQVISNLHGTKQDFYFFTSQQLVCCSQPCSNENASFHLRY